MQIIVVAVMCQMVESNHMHLMCFHVDGKGFKLIDISPTMCV